MNFIKKLVFWIVNHKDTITTWAGTGLAFLVWLNDYLASGNALDPLSLLKAFLTWLIGYLIGKNKFNIPKPK